MTQEEFIDVIEFLAAFAIILWFSAGAWRVILIDGSRRRYFILRDRLFLMAVNGKIEFSNPAYKHLRDYLNTKIEAAPSSTIEILLTAAMHTNFLRPSYKPEPVYDEIDNIEDENVKNTLREIKNTAQMVWLDHMLFPSPALCIVVGLIPGPFIIIFFLPLFAITFGGISAWRRNMKRIENFLFNIVGADAHHLGRIKPMH